MVKLRYGTLTPTFKTQDSGVDMSVLTMQDRDMLAHYMTLALADRKTVCDGVAALTVVATVKLEIYKKQAPSPRGISTASYK